MLNITARIDSINALGEMQIMFNASIDIPNINDLNKLINNSIIDIYI